ELRISGLADRRPVLNGGGVAEDRNRSGHAGMEVTKGGERGARIGVDGDEPVGVRSIRKRRDCRPPGRVANLIWRRRCTTGLEWPKGREDSWAEQDLRSARAQGVFFIGEEERELAARHPLVGGHLDQVVGDRDAEVEDVAL